MKYTLREAAEAAKVHRSTIHRYIKEGRLSAERQEDNTYRIDASEMARVFPSATSQDRPRDVTGDVARQHEKAPETPVASPAAEVEIMRWQTKAEMLERLLEREREVVASLQRQLEAAQEAVAVAQATARETVAAFTRQLPAPTSTPAPEPSTGFLARLLGRG